MAIKRKIALAAAVTALAAVLAVAWLAVRPAAPGSPDGPAVVGEARRGGLTVALPAAVADVRIRAASTPGRPIVLIDPGHGGRDPARRACPETSPRNN